MGNASGEIRAEARFIFDDRTIRPRVRLERARAWQNPLVDGSGSSSFSSSSEKRDRNKVREGIEVAAKGETNENATYPSYRAYL